MARRNDLRGNDRQIMQCDVPIRPCLLELLMISNASFMEVAFARRARISACRCWVWTKQTVALLERSRQSSYLIAIDRTA